MVTAGTRQSRIRSILAALVWPFGALLSWLGQLGQGGLNGWQAGTYRLAVIWTTLSLAVRPSSWPRTVRNVFARQMLFTGVDSLSFTVRIALAVGIVVIVQSELWLQGLDQGDLSARLFLTILVRELGPLLANFVVIVRSATAIATELANMKLAGEVDVLDSQGLDPMTYLVMPRVLSVACSVFCLGVIFVIVCFAAGYVVGTLIGAITGGPYLFFEGVARSLQLEDLLFFVPKTFLTGLFVGVIASIEGLSVKGAVTEVPQVASRSAIYSLTAVLVVSAILSLMIYGRLLIFQVL